MDHQGADTVCLRDKVWAHAEVPKNEKEVAPSFSLFSLFLFAFRLSPPAPSFLFFPHQITASLSLSVSSPSFPRTLISRNHADAVCLRSPVPVSLDRPLG